jgi:PAS domain S-box-containing protein
MAALKRALDLTEDRLSLALESARMGSWDWDIDADTLDWTPMCKSIFGMAAEEPISYSGFLDRVHPDDRAPVDALCRSVLDPDIRAPYDVEYRAILPDGSVRWVLSRGRAYFVEGRAIRFIGAVIDVTEQKESEARLRSLVHELAHRVKNTLAVVQSIAEQTFRGARDVMSIRDALMGRLQALADTHTLLSQANWQSVDLASLVERVAGRLVPKDDGRFALAGPALQLRPKAALALGLVLHELAMNAARHGAWSAPCGKVSCRWSRVDGAVAFEWSETGLENLAPPTRKGFGFRLINQAVAYDVAGKASQTWRPEGLIYALIIPSQRW